ncbi:MAG TPA: DUF2809 domain-containing protein [Crinalium sp.]|jgi:hypothetical protein
MGVVVPLGFWVRFYSPAPEWLNDALGSVAYEIFWILLFVFLLPKRAPIRAAIAIFLITCALEVLQLWQAPWLQAARATLAGRLVLGNTFSWSDFPAYIVGSALGWLVVRSLRRALNLPQKL